MAGMAAARDERATAIGTDAAAVPSPDRVSAVHDAFISYSRKDKDFARKLEKSLKAYKPPRALDVAHRYLDIFRDEEDFTGADYHSSIARHLNASRKLLVLCSPHARASKYVDDEVRRFAALRGADNIIPLLVGGLPNNETPSGQEDQAAFPDGLCETLEMPLGIDYRGYLGDERYAPTCQNLPSEEKSQAPADGRDSKPQGPR